MKSFKQYNAFNQVIDVILLLSSLFSIYICGVHVQERYELK